MSKYLLWYRRMLDISGSQGLIEERNVDLQSNTLVAAYNEARDWVKHLTFDGHYMLAVGLYDENDKLIGEVEREP